MPRRPRSLRAVVCAVLTVAALVLTGCSGGDGRDDDQGAGGGPGASGSDGGVEIPALDRTWTYLTEDAGAETTAVRDPGGHGLRPDAVGTVARWLTARLNDEGATS